MFTIKHAEYSATKSHVYKDLYDHMCNMIVDRE